MFGIILVITGVASFLNAFFTLSELCAVTGLVEKVGYTAQMYTKRSKHNFSSSKISLRLKQKRYESL